jgi:glycosyltransferase involved in cell wall biosynthesis
MRIADFTVVIPAYNPEAMLREAIDSVLRQSVLPQEILVVDDGSQVPVTLDLSHPEVTQRVIRQANSGYGAAVNTGIGATATDLVGFLDHDDLGLPGKVETQLELLGPEVSVVGGATRVVDLRRREGTPPETVVQGSRVFGACMFRVSTFATLGGLTEDRRTGEPFEWWSRFSKSGEIAVFTDSPVLERRIHGQNLGIVHGEKSKEGLLYRVRMHHQGNR